MTDVRTSTNLVSRLLLLVLAVSAQVDADQRLPKVLTAPVTYQPVDYRIRTFGVLAPRTEQLSFAINGRIDDFIVEEGQSVEKGALIATLETDDAEIEVKQKQVDLDQALRQLDRVTELFNQQFAQESELERARVNVQQARIAFTQAEENLERCYLRAPADGLILRQLIKTRTSVSAGTPTFVFQASSEAWIALIRLSDSNAFTLREGATADVTFAPYPGQVFPASLTRMARIANAQDGLYTAEVTVETGDTQLRPGMVAEVNLEQRSDEMFHVVPLDAFVDMRRDKGTIYLVDSESGNAVEKRVTVARVTGNDVAVVDSLAGFERVIVRGQSRLQDQVPVEIID